jgi:hybrid cluster-associated redox disulfide protein
MQQASPSLLDVNKTMAEVMACCPAAARVLVRHRMHCVGCVFAPFETLAEACAAYGVSVERLLAELADADHTEGEEIT